MDIQGSNVVGRIIIFYHGDLQVVNQAAVTQNTDTRMHKHTHTHTCHIMSCQIKKVIWPNVAAQCLRNKETDLIGVRDRAISYNADKKGNCFLGGSEINFILLTLRLLSALIF